MGYLDKRSNEYIPHEGEKVVILQEFWDEQTVKDYRELKRDFYIVDGVGLHDTVGGMQAMINLRNFKFLIGGKHVRPYKDV